MHASGCGDAGSQRRDSRACMQRDYGENVCEGRDVLCSLPVCVFDDGGGRGEGKGRLVCFSPSEESMLFLCKGKSHPLHHVFGEHDNPGFPFLSCVLACVCGCVGVCVHARRGGLLSSLRKLCRSQLRPISFSLTLWDFFSPEKERQDGEQAVCLQQDAQGSRAQ